MPSLLQLDSSADLADSRTRALTRAFADAWRARGADHTVVVRDLHVEPLPHLQTPAQHWSEELRGGAPVPPELDVLQAAIVDELLAADAVVIGAPMYNYAMPSTLKAWIDHIHVPGRTAPFPGHETQPMAGRPAVVITARGAAYEPATIGEWDHVTPPIRLILGTSLGMTVEVVATERTLADRIPALGADEAAAEFAAADAAVRALATRL